MRASKEMSRTACTTTSWNETTRTVGSNLKYIGMNCYNIDKHKLVIVHMSSSSRLGAGVWLAYGVARE